MKNNTKKIVITSMLASLCCVATMVIKIPSPLKGYLNLGDCIVLISGWLLSPVYAFFAAGAGSAFADIFSGYMMYAPATFVIKGIMAVVVHLCHKAIHNTLGNIPAKIIGGSLAEIIMIFGYYIFEGFLYGFGPSVVNIPANAVQGVAGLVVGILLVKVFEKTKIF